MCSLVELIRGVMLVVEAAAMEPNTQICGANVIIDFMGLSVQHVWQFSPSFAKMFLEWVQVSDVTLIILNVKCIFTTQ